MSRALTPEPPVSAEDYVLTNDDVRVIRAVMRYMEANMGGDLHTFIDGPDRQTEATWPDLFRQFDEVFGDEKSGMPVPVRLGDVKDPVNYHCWIYLSALDGCTPLYSGRVVMGTYGPRNEYGGEAEYQAEFNTSVANVERLKDLFDEVTKREDE